MPGPCHPTHYYSRGLVCVILRPAQQLYPGTITVHTTFLGPHRRHLGEALRLLF